MIRPRALAVLSLLFAFIATARPKPLEEAIGLYETGELAKAKERLTALVKGGSLSGPDGIDAKMYLAAAEYASGDERAARVTLRELAKEHPTATMDPAIFVPEVVALWQRARTESATDAIPPPVPLPVSDGRPAVITFIPFGVGQMSNGERVKGLVFMGCEATAFTISAVSLAVLESSKLPGGRFLQSGTFVNVDQARTLNYVYVAAFWTGVALAVTGVVDAFLQRTGQSGLSPKADGS